MQIIECVSELNAGGQVVDAQTEVAAAAELMSNLDELCKRAEGAREDYRLLLEQKYYDAVVKRDDALALDPSERAIARANAMNAYTERMVRVADGAQWDKLKIIRDAYAIGVEAATIMDGL
jgi:hypothetical protein